MNKFVGTDSFRWLVGNGGDVLFWLDKWAGDKILKESFPRLFLLAIDKYAKVRDYACNGSFNHERWVSLFRRNLFQWEGASLQKLCGVLEGISLVTNKHDKIVWEHDVVGKFSVKKLSALLSSPGENESKFEFYNLWRINIPPKVQYFMWMLIVDRLPTKAFLRKRGLPLTMEQSLCPWCNLKEENVDHVLFNCSWTYKFWCLFLQWWKFSWVQPLSLNRFLLTCFDSGFTGIMFSAWIASCAAAVWSLWLARNESVFEQKQWIIKDIVFLVKLRSLFWIKALRKADLILEDKFWSDPSSCLLRGMIKRTRICTEWNHPLDNCLKFNVDGSAYGKPGPAGCGGILRNERGRILALFSGPLGILESNIAEVMAIKVVLGMFVRSIWKGKFGLVIESDSMTAVRWCTDKESRPWKLWEVFGDIDKLMEDIGNVSLAHIYREGNDLADSLAKAGVDRSYMLEKSFISGL